MHLCVTLLCLCSSLRGYSYPKLSSQAFQKQLEGLVCADA